MNLPLNIDWQQILLHLFNFVILAGGLYFLLYKPVKSFMDQRQEHYRRLDTEADSKLAQAEQLKADYRKRLEEADHEIEKKRSEAIKQAQDAGSRMVEEAGGQAAEILSNARQEAQREKERILEDAQKEIVELAVMAADKLLLKNSAGDVFDQFLNVAESKKRRGETE